MHSLKLLKFRYNYTQGSASILSVQLDVFLMNACTTVAKAPINTWSIAIPLESSLCFVLVTHDTCFLNQG